MNQSKNIKGIIYRVYSSGEADKVIYVIDESGNKIIATAKGVKKNNSRKASSIDLANYISFKVVEGYKLPLMTEVKLIEEFGHWKKDYSHLITLQFFCEIIDKFCMEGIEDKGLFEEFKTILNYKGERIVFAAAVFLLKILYVSGNLPKLNECVITGEKIEPEKIYFSDEHIGYITEDCLQNGNLSADKIPARIAKTQKFITENNFDKAMTITLDPKEERKMLLIEIRWVELMLDLSLKSKDMFLKAHF